MLKIIGKAQASVAQMQAYIKKVNPEVSDSVIKMIPLYITEGTVEGIRGDIAFAQSCLETGNFTFSGSAVTLDQNNFCGMGVTKTGTKGNSFKTPAEGIRAQIQHLQAYASTDRLKNRCVDPRYTYVQRGCAEYVEYLGIQENPKGQGWTAGRNYGQKIINILNYILSIKTEKESDTMITITKMISKKNCYIGQNKPAYVVIHETDNWSKGADAKAHATAMKNGNLAGTVHYYVDSKSIYQTLDHSDGAWAVGDGKGKYGITNRNSINIEICVNPETDYYKAVDYAERLAAKLLKQYGWGTDRLKRHYDASRKNCPRRIQAEGRWPEFVKKTAAYMKGASTVSTKTNTTSNTAKKTVALTGKIEVQLPVIKKGSSGTAVSMLQAMLCVNVDGKFGNATETALKTFQKNVKISADGICGANTWKKVIEHMKVNTK
jgi:N-acetylmuramoyl-L-alanine amidase CwlA|nr:MAG TPA: N-acetylmuramoyl-L-alanine amidase [Caudoviricetes sp.]